MFCNPDITCPQVSLDCILESHKQYKRLLVGHMATLSVGHNRPYGQPLSNKPIIELKSMDYDVISRHWKFMFKRTWQVVFWGTRNVFGVPKLSIGIIPSKVGWIWCFYDKNMPIVLLMIIQKRSLSRIVTNML